MKYRVLGKSDLSVSSIGLGCVTFGREIDEANAFVLMDHALDRGINLFDTAEAYAAGTSEEVVGRWIESRGVRDQIILATKVAGSLTRKRIQSSVEASLRRLKTDRIDLFQLHHWDQEAPLAETLAALEDLMTQGKVSYIGCSNYNAEQLRQAIAYQTSNGWSTMSSVQPNYNLVVREIEKELIPLCAAQQVGIISYSPLGAGFLTGKYRKGGPIPAGTRFDIIPGHQGIYFSEDNFRKVEKLRDVANASGVSMVQLALAWVINQPGITSVLIGGRTVDHIDQAFHAEALPMTADLQMTLTQL
ncbi:MAG: aldo/keto reductase [Ardenticatenaceae bacterium]|nr:aldo/keto reductase [Ardenticatenaceae bacterium]